MTINEMHLAFKIELDKTSALELPSFEPEEIDFWLNNAIRRFVKNRFLGTDKNQSFEENIKRIEDLKTLIVEEVIDDSDFSTSLKPNAVSVPMDILTYDKWFVLGDEVDIYYENPTTNLYETKRQGVLQCTLDTYRSHIDDPYSEHKLHYEEAKPLRLFHENNIELVTDGNYDIVKYYIRYLRKPQEVSISTSTGCDLPEHTHDEIVKLAVNMVLENIEQPRYQTHMNELNKVE